MTLSEELVWRGFKAENTFKDATELDSRPRKFYWGCDPSADSLTIGNLAAGMMVRCFIKHGYTPYLLVGGATGRIGDPKDNEERQLKSIEEIGKNVAAIEKQLKQVIGGEFTLVDNYDWFKEIKYLDFLREVGKQFSMTQLLDREFVKARIGEGGVGISYAEFSYSLIQGYDFLHLFRKYGVDLQLCGADQFGNCASGMHLIKRLDGARVDIWSTPLIIDKVSGRKFGKSEGNAVWLSENRTSVFNYYQFWLNQADEGVEDYLKIYTPLEKKEIDKIMAEHVENPAKRLAQKTLAYESTKVVHGEEKADNAVKITAVLYEGGKFSDLSETELELLAKEIPHVKKLGSVTDILVAAGEAMSKGEAKRLISGGGVTVNGQKINEDILIESKSLIKKGKNKFVLVG